MYVLSTLTVPDCSVLKWDTDLVWHSISDGFAQVTNTWWENEEIVDLTSEFVRVSIQWPFSWLPISLTHPHRKCTGLSCSVWASSTQLGNTPVLPN